MKKRFYIIGNWKMYKTAREAVDYIERLIGLIQNTSQHVYLAVPFTAIGAAAKAAKGYPIEIGAQNMSDAREGAFTGEIASLMLKEAGAAFVLLGHSERRVKFSETDEMVQSKMLRAIFDEIRPILCVGETLQEKELGQTEMVLRRQLTSALGKIPEGGTSLLMIAYEPVWAIGSGQVGNPEEMNEIHHFIRSVLVDLFGPKQGAIIPILYGGSITSENIESLITKRYIDGVLVGKASLNPETFSLIIHQCEKKK